MRHKTLQIACTLALTLMVSAVSSNRIDHGKEKDTTENQLSFQEKRTKNLIPYTVNHKKSMKEQKSFKLRSTRVYKTNERSKNGNNTKWLREYYMK